jgi:uncharacterized membrane protein YbhN (UPF0104 family)
MEKIPNAHISFAKLQTYLGIASLITMLTASLNALRIGLLALALELNLDLVESIAASSFATLAGLVPVSIAGIGTRDLTLIGILNHIGYTQESIISFSALILLLTLFNVLLGPAIWLGQKSCKLANHFGFQTQNNLVERNEK